MSAYIHAPLTDSERASMQAERDLTVKVRSEYRARLYALRVNGAATESAVRTLEYQIAMCSIHVRRFDEELAR